MKRSRLAGVLVTLGLLIGGGFALRGPAGATSVQAASNVAPAQQLDVFYTPPILVRAGESVRLPVDVVCATARGRSCPSDVVLAARTGSGRWQRAEVAAVNGLEFDLSGPAGRAGDGGAVDFFLGAAAGSRSEQLGSAVRPLHFYVTENLPVVRFSALPFGRTRGGVAMLSLPWGTGPDRAGLLPGKEAETLGPSSFDLDSRGRIHLVDAMQKRLAVFADGRLVAETPVAVSADADVAVGEDGRAYVLDSVRGVLVLHTFGPDGRPQGSLTLGRGVLSQVRVVGGRPFVHELPLNAWVDVTRPASALSVGMPMADGSQLLRVATEEFVRLGTLRGGRVVDAVELRTSQHVGDVPLAEPDGRGGYLVVVHLWRDVPAPADQYQFLRVSDGRVVRTFAIANEHFAHTPALSRFRIGPDGALYQLVTSPEGMRIVRFDLGEER